MSESLPQKIELLPDGEIKTKLSNCLKVEGLTDSLTLARACAETLVRELYLGLNAPAPFLLDDCIRGLRDETINPGTVPVHVVNYLDNCKVLGNPAAHGRSVAVDLPLHLSDLLRVAEWYYRSFVPGMKGRANSGRAAPSRRPTSDLREVPMVNELATRGRAKGSLASKLYAAISGPGGVSPLLRLIQEQCPAYDDCGLSHACRIMTRVHGILTPAAREQLNAPELFSFVYATISNTAGLSAQAAEAQLEKALRGCALSDQEIKRWAAAINVVLDAQTASRDQLRSHVGFGKDTTIDQYTIRPRLLAMLLRIGDLLDLDSERPDPHCVSAYWGASPARSRRRRGKVEHFVCNPQQLRIRVVCEDKLSHQTASRWLEHLREDIAFAALFVFRQDLTAFQLPAPEVCVERAAGAAYTLWPLRFEIDQDGHLWEVLRRSVYTGPYDYVREIVSNAIDACVRYMFDHAGTPISPQNANSPRSWVLPGYDPLVLVLFDRHESRLAICDNGVGMDTEDLQNFLFKVAGRGAARRKRDVELPTIGQFGVGFISILTRADSVRLATCRHTGGNGLLVDITSGLREASVEELRGSPDPGTSIVLHLKEKEPDLSRYGEADARAHLERILLYPSIRVALIDCDALQKLHSQVQDLDPSPSPPISEWFAVAETRIKPLHQIIEEADGIVRRASEIMRRENHRRKDESE
ncbi:MAG TPA: ATP-binding protein, partial [Gemmataceae bacterium]|nr:ATP-binding protein [Gemmataceae bacterium]